MAKAHWIHLTLPSDLDEALDRSETQPVVVFKHSTRCPVSAMALRLFERDWDAPEPAFHLCFLDLIAYRSISNRVAEELGVDHESPQAIVIKNRRAVYHASHNDISAQSIINIVK